MLLDNHVITSQTSVSQCPYQRNILSLGSHSFSYILNRKSSTQKSTYLRYWKQQSVYCGTLTHAKIVLLISRLISTTSRYTWFNILPLKHPPCHYQRQDTGLNGLLVRPCMALLMCWQLIYTSSVPKLAQFRVNSGIFIPHYIVCTYQYCIALYLPDVL